MTVFNDNSRNLDGFLVRFRDTGSLSAGVQTDAFVNPDNMLSQRNLNLYVNRHWLIRSPEFQESGSGSVAEYATRS